jgi:hypothetical protein
VRCSAKGNGRKVTSGIPEPVRNGSCSTLELVFGCRANSATSSGNTGIVELYAGLLLSHRQFTAWVEITHPRGLKGWLEPERARLEALRSLQVDAATWDRNGRDTAFLNHRNKRLGDVTALVATERYRRRLAKLELDYVAACEVAEGLAKRQTRQGQVLIGVLAVLLALVGLGWWNQEFFREQYHWRMTMGPSVLSVEQEREKTTKPGSDFEECVTGCPTMVVPAGRFTMGSPEGEKDRSESEGPQHDVTIAKPFAVDKTEVTFAEWDICVAAGACQKAPDSGWGRDDRPAGPKDLSHCGRP